MSGCDPSCLQKICGDDGCGGSCGDCEGDDTCDAGVCAPPAECVPACDAKTCGDDGCGGSCGTCDDPNTTCVNSNCCTPDCADKTCGNDGCGGSCGTCAADEQCSTGVCEAKTYTCSELFGLAQGPDCDWTGDLAGCQAEITDAVFGSVREFVSEVGATGVPGGDAGWRALAQWSMRQRGERLQPRLGLAATPAPVLALPMPPARSLPAPMPAPAWVAAPIVTQHQGPSPAR